MKGISAVVITLNEENNIGRCLDSVKNVVEEMIVVDSYSTDRTVEISQSKGAIVVQMEWEGYAQTKNKANQLSNYEYIFSIDADEALSDQLKASILEYKNKGLNGVYECKRLTNYCGKWIKHGGWYPDKKVRLFPKDQAEWQGEFVHETLELKGNPPKTLLEGDLLHYSFDSIEDHKNRINRYAKLEARKKLSKGKQHYVFSMLLSPVVKFIKMYLLKLGFLDGYYGFMVAAMSGYADYRKYKELGKLLAEEKEA